MRQLDEQQVRLWWEVFCKEKKFTEIRILDDASSSGYFGDVETLIRCVRPYADRYPIYFSMNEADPSLYERKQKDRFLRHVKETLKDQEMITRRWVLIDCDPVRRSGVCSDDYEVGLARAKGNEIYKFLVENGFNKPVCVFSSSGVHLYLKLNVPVNEQTDKIFRKFLYALDMLFSDDNVKVDTVVHNAARVSRLPGSWSTKGSENSIDRPQRMCHFVNIPEQIKETDIAYFEKIANIYPEEEPQKQTRYYGNQQRGQFNLDEWLQRYGIEVTRIERVNGGSKYILAHCPFNPDHKGKDAVIFRRDTGEIAFHCFHNSCADHTWRDLRLMFEPDAYTKAEQTAFQHNFNRFKRIQQEEPTTITKNEKDGEIWLKMSQIKSPSFDINDYIPSGFKQIDERAYGFKRKYITVWSGKRASGKTSLLGQLALNAANKGYTGVFYSGELSGAEQKTWLYRQAAGKLYNVPIDGKYGLFYDVKKDVIPYIDKWIDDKIFLWNNNYGNNYKQIVEQVYKLHEHLKFDYIIFDNLTMLDIDDMDYDRNDKQKKFLISLKKLAEDLNIHIHVVIHPHKQQLGQFLRVENVSGSGGMTDLAQNVMLLHRTNRDFEINAKTFFSNEEVNEIYAEGATNVIEVGKWRDNGAFMGHLIKLFFEQESKRLKNNMADNEFYGWVDSYNQEYSRMYGYQQPPQAQAQPQKYSDTLKEDAHAGNKKNESFDTPQPQVQEQAVAEENNRTEEHHTSEHHATEPPKATERIVLIPPNADVGAKPSLADAVDEDEDEDDDSDSGAEGYPPPEESGGYNYGYDYSITELPY